MQYFSCSTDGENANRKRPSVACSSPQEVPKGVDPLNKFLEAVHIL